VDDPVAAFQRSQCLRTQEVVGVGDDAGFHKSIAHV
jgi:hypothetical protein